MIGRRPLLLGTASLALAVEVRSQSPARAVVGFLNNQSPSAWTKYVNAFLLGLREGGFKAGENVVVEFRWANGQNDRLAGLAAELVKLNVNVLVATGGPDTVKAAKTSTQSIPIVFTLGADPQALGFVDSLSRPSENITGVALFTEQLGPKRLELLREIILKPDVIGILFNRTHVNFAGQLSILQSAAQNLGIKLIDVGVNSLNELGGALQTLAGAGAKAVLPTSDSLFFANSGVVCAAMANVGLPAVYEAREFVDAGGLMSYGVDFAHGYRRAGRYTAQILKGAKPSELPVEQPTRFELAINLKAAKALGITIPPSVAIRADEVIE